MYEINSFSFFPVCSWSPKETFNQKERVAEGYPDGATGHFSRPGRGRCSYFFVRHANFETDFNRVKINIKKK